MHFIESRSHQFPLPHNVHLSATGWELDPIDRPSHKELAQTRPVAS